MNRPFLSHNRLIVLIASCAVLLIAGLGALVLNHDGSKQSATKSSKQSSSGTQNSTITSADAAPTPTTTAPVKVVANEIAAPSSHTFRTPVRCSEPGGPKTGGLPGDSPIGAKKWVTVGSLDGSCDLSSKSFHLNGIDTRLVWRSDASSFVAFLLDPNGLDSSAGFADAECSGPCADYQSLTNKAATYTLRVQADGGPWQVLVQEFR